MDLLSIFRRQPATKTLPDATLGFYLAPDGKQTAVKSSSSTWQNYNAPSSVVILDGTSSGLAFVYEASVWAARCVLIKAKAVGRMKWQIVDKTTNREIANHPLATAFLRNRQKLLRKIEWALGIWGEAFIELAAHPGRLPTDLYWLNNLGVEPQTAPGYISEYLYSPVHGGRVEQFNPARIAFMKTDNPFDDLRGLSPFIQVLNEVGISYDAARVARAYYANDAKVGALLIPENDLSDTDAQRFTDYFNANLKGPKNAGKTVLMPKNIKYERVQLQPTAADIEQRMNARREICAAEGVPLSVAGAWDDAQYQSAPEQRKSFYEDTVIPDCDDIADFINTEMLPRFDPRGNARFIFIYDEIRALIEDEEKKLTSLNNKLLAGGITLNQYRKEIKQPPLSNGDVLYIPTNITVTPLDKLGQMPAAPAPSPFGAPYSPLLGGQHPSTAVSPTPFPPQAPPKQIPVNVPPRKAVADTVAKTEACYVILSLANDAVIKGIQTALRSDYPYVEWSDPASFHITLVYAPKAADLQTIQDLLPKSINALNLEIGPVDTFEGKDPAPVILRVRPTGVLRAVQNHLYSSFKSVGLDLSEYSEPTAWQPHITLGYMPAGSPLPNYQDVKTVTTGNLEATIEQGDSFKKIAVSATKTTDGFPRQDGPLDELAAWQKKATNGGAAKALGFVCSQLDPYTQHLVRERLAALDKDASKAAIKQVYADTQALLADPVYQESLDYWREYDALQQELGADWLSAYMEPAYQRLQGQLNAGLTSDTLQQVLNDYHSDLIEEWIGTPETPGPLARLISAGMAAGQASLARGTAANPARPVKALEVNVDWDLLNREALDFARRYMYDLIRGLDDTTREQVRVALEQWLASGEPLDSLKQKMDDIFHNPVRAALIAQTESSRAYTNGAFARWQQVDVQKAQRVSVNDKDVCDLCQRWVDAGPVDLNTGWFDSVTNKTYRDMAHPGDRCFWRPVL